ncbi:hypothetical protein FRX31_034224 [Thalictrum thalictroides]|uniref:Uncharacterized protein n=1 Tax=Thalictrum thalictroides TaxID=46969 RepID=A0A7J6UUE8_THATH|nr:hypothetical protein FRX31_034224 [Thalictrum thalictroides]
MLESWSEFKSKEVVAAMWDILSYALIWTVWRVRNEVIFRDRVADCNKILQRVKATIWGWLNISKKSMELRKQITFTDVLFGWRYVMVEQW